MMFQTEQRGVARVQGTGGKVIKEGCEQVIKALKAELQITLIRRNYILPGVLREGKWGEEVGCRGFAGQ